MSGGFFAKEADWRSDGPVAELTANRDVVGAQEELLVTAIYLLGPFHEVVQSLFVANMRRYYVVVALLGFLEQIIVPRIL